jgi:hypothetical protein
MTYTISQAEELAYEVGRDNAEAYGEYDPPDNPLLGEDLRDPLEVIAEETSSALYTQLGIYASLRESWKRGIDSVA